MGYIRVRNVGKAYKRYPRKWGRLAEWLGMRSRHELRWVLQGVEFDVAPGEGVGIIGFNGAGKSTLLKIISGTTRPTTGTVEVGGRVSALLELGIGFHPDFTGRENVFMAGQLRGLGSREIDGRMREIEDFAEIGDYMDQPLRVYSSGMQLRLAFSVATVVRPDVLIVDEALAVGDVLFQQKCFDRIRRYREAGTTLLFVSHALGSVYSLCDRAMLIDGGRIAIDGTAKEAIDLYSALALRARDGNAASLAIAGAGTSPTPASNAKTPPDVPQALAAGSGTAATAVDPAAAPAGSYSKPGASIIAVRLLVGEHPADAFVSESEIAIEVTARFIDTYTDPHVGFQIRNARGEPVFMTNTHCMGVRVGHVQRGDEISVAFRFRAALAAGDYSITAGLADGGLIDGFFREALTRVQEIRTFTVLTNMESILWSGVVNLDPRCDVRRGHAPPTDEMRAPGTDRRDG